MGYVDGGAECSEEDDEEEGGLWNSITSTFSSGSGKSSDDSSDETINVEPVFYSGDVKDKLEKNLMMFYTRLKRDASEVLESQNKAINEKTYKF